MLQLVPLPGVGAIIAGAKNPHSKLIGRGVAQASLVLFGSYPLIIPGVAGLIWAIFDAIAIARRSAGPAPWTQPTPDADPETLTPTRAELRAAKATERDARKAERTADREARAAERAARSAEKAADKAASKEAKARAEAQAAPKAGKR